MLNNEKTLWIIFWGVGGESWSTAFSPSNMFTFCSWIRFSHPWISWLYPRFCTHPANVWCHCSWQQYLLSYPWFCTLLLCACPTWWVKIYGWWKVCLELDLYNKIYFPPFFFRIPSRESGWISTGTEYSCNPGHAVQQGWFEPSCSGSGDLQKTEWAFVKRGCIAIWFGWQEG